MAEDTDILDKTGADKTSGDDKDKKPVELTKEQQEHVNTIFNKRFATITKKYEDQLTHLTSELEQVKTSNADKTKDEGTDKTGDDSPEKKQFKQLLEAEKNKAKLAEAESKRAQEDAKAARTEASKVRKEVAIARAASKQNFYELDVVSSMVWDKVEYDEDTKTFVVKDNGAIKQNSSLVNMTLDEYFTEFAGSRPYLVNGDVKSGSNSTEANKNNGASSIKSKKDLKTPKEKSDYITKFGLEKFEDLPKE